MYCVPPRLWAANRYLTAAEASVSTCGGGTRLQDAELVALGVRHHDPTHVPLSDVDVARAQAAEPLRLGRLVIGPQIEMDPVLDRLRLGDLEKQDVRKIAAWFEPPLTAMGSLHRQAECLTPENGRRARDRGNRYRR